MSDEKTPEQLAAEQQATEEAARIASEEAAKKAQKTPEEIAAEEASAKKIANDEAAAKIAEETERKAKNQEAAWRRLQREKAEATAERDAYRAQMARLSEVNNDQQNGKPQREQFGNDADFIEALTDYKVNLVRQENEVNLRRIQSQNQAVQFQQKVDEVRTELQDFDEVIANNPVRFQRETQEAIQSSPVAAHVAYEIAKDIDLAERIAALPPMQAAREIGKIEARIEAERKQRKQPNPASASKAPAPVTPLKTSGPAAPRSSQEISDREWVDQRRRKKYSNA
jgi:hypothetical protein